MLGHHLHHTLIGHRVVVHTPGDVPHAGLLVSVGEDRLVLAMDGGSLIVPVDRLLTTRLERPDED